MPRPPRLQFRGAHYHMVTRRDSLLPDTQSHPCSAARSLSQIWRLTCSSGPADAPSGTPNLPTTRSAIWRFAVPTRFLSRGLPPSWGAWSSGGVVLWSQGDPAQALPYLEQTAAEAPEWNLPVAVLHRMRRDPLAARRAAERAARHYEQAVKAQTRQWDLRLRWAQSEVLLQDYSKAARILRAGLDSPDPQRFHDALVEVYLDWYAATNADSAKGVSTRLELLNRALEHGPHHPRLLTVFAELSGQQGQQGEMSQRAIREALADGTAPATVHLILGTQALEQGDLERCQMHLELAAQQAPRMPIVLNNLAWVLAHRENPELDRAHALAQRATDLVSRPEFYYTLATILARQGKYLEAIAQFETVLRLASSRTDVYQPLAELYRKLGDFELAELYDDRAQAARENQ